MIPSIGAEIIFNFHGFGVISEEKTKVVDLKDDIITISEGEPNYKFDLKTGKCLNDNAFMGCKRTLPKKYLL